MASARIWEGRSSDCDIETVRELSNWTPKSHPPPTARLKLRIGEPNQRPSARRASVTKVVRVGSNGKLSSIKHLTPNSTNANSHQQNNDQSQYSQRFDIKPKSNGSSSSSRLVQHNKTPQATSRGSNTNNVNKLVNARQKLPQHLRDKIQSKSRHMRQAFRLMDLDKDNTITPREFQNALSDMGLSLNDYEVRKIMSVVDTDGNKGVNFVEFCDAFFVESNEDSKPQQLAPVEPVRGKRQHASQKDHAASELFVNIDTAGREEREKRREEVRLRRRAAMLNQIPRHLKDKIEQKSKCISSVFLSMDTDKSGSISATEFRHGMADLGVALNDNEMGRIMQVVDKDKSGTMEYEEFCNAFLGSDKNSINLAAAEAKEQIARREKHWTKYDVADPKDVIAPQVWRSEEMNKSHRDKLKTQVKITQQLEAKCSNPNDKARAMVRLYRSCGPDEFGFIPQKGFEKILHDQFGVSKESAVALFKLGVPRSETGEMNYEEFRRALSRVDSQPEGGHVTTRDGSGSRVNDASSSSTPSVPHIVGGEGGTKKRSKVRGRAHRVPPSEQGPSGKIGAIPAKPKAFTEMGVTERREFRHRNRILQLIEQNKHRLKDKFRERKELDSHTTSIKTRISFDRLADTIEGFGVAVDPATLKELYQPHADEPRDPHGSDTITFSQLCRRTEDYFQRLQSGDDNTGPPANERNMELKGRYLGCRKQGTGAASHNQASPDPSKFWSHDEIPRRKRAVGNCTDRSDSSAANLPEIYTGRTEGSWTSTARTLDGLDTSRMDTERRMRVEKQRLWRSRWTDKTLERKRRDGIGGSRKAHGPIANQMSEGNGNFLLWGQEGHQGRASNRSLPTVPETVSRSIAGASPWAVDENTRYW